MYASTCRSLSSDTGTPLFLPYQMHRTSEGFGAAAGWFHDSCISSIGVGAYPASSISHEKPSRAALPVARVTAIDRRA